MENIEGFVKMAVTIKGKPTERLVSKFDKKIIITPEMSEADKNKAIALSKQKESQGFTALTIVTPSPTMQSPTNKWMLQDDGNYYKAPETPKGVPEKKKGAGTSRISIVDGKLVFIRYGNNIRSFIQTSKNAPYNFIDVLEAKAVPYHLYVLKNKSAYGLDNPLVSWAENVDKGKIESVPIASSSSSNSFENKSSIDATNMLDFSGGNSNMLDSDIISKFSGNSVRVANNRSFGRRNRSTQVNANVMAAPSLSSFNGGAMPDFRGGDISDFDGDSNFNSNVGMDLSCNGEQSNFTSNEKLDLGCDGKKSNFSLPNTNTNLELSIDGSESNFSSNVGMYLSIDGKSSLSEIKKSVSNIKAFQDWLDVNVPTWLEGHKLNKNVKLGYGTFGGKSKAAWDKINAPVAKTDTKPTETPVEKTEDKPIVADVNTPVTPKEADKLADKNKTVYTPEEAQKLYASSGSKSKFADWIKSDSSKTFLNSIKDLGSAFLLKKSKENADSAPPLDSSDTGIGAVKEKTILGMHPLTFGLVAGGAGLLLIITIALISRHKGAKVALPTV